MANLYYAKWHVRLGDDVIRPGEVFEAEPDDADVNRLLEIGAAERCMADITGDGEYIPAEPEKPEDEEEDGTDEEPSAQIDVMDGIVKTGSKRRTRK